MRRCCSPPTLNARAAAVKQHYFMTTAVGTRLIFDEQNGEWLSDSLYLVSTWCSLRFVAYSSYTPSIGLCVCFKNVIVTSSGQSRAQWD